MDHEQTLSSTKVAVLGGLLLLGLMALAAFVLLTASPAGAQTDESQNGSQNGSEPASSDASQAQEPAPAESAKSDRAEAPPEDGDQGDQGVVEAERTPSGSTEARVNTPPPPAPVDTLVEPVLPSVELVVPLDLPSVVPELPSPPVNVSVAPARPRPAPIADAPAVNAPPPAPEAPDANLGAETPTAPTARVWTPPPSRSTTAFRSDSLPSEGGTRAPPFGLPPAVAAPSSSVSSSSARDFGQSLLLFGVIVAGIAFALTRGRRLLAEALGWLPAPWLALIERPG